MFIAALDVGSVATKAILWAGREAGMVASSLVPSAWRPRAAAREALKRLRAARPDIRPGLLALTGYGRRLLGDEPTAEDDFGLGQIRSLSFNEISALARGLNLAAPELRLILDVGGQDSKALAIDENGRLLDFMLNDKCAAGAGAFIDGLCQSFDLDHQGFDALAGRGRPVPLSSMCAVFAQTELVAQIAKGVSRADLAAGIMASLAARLKAQCGRIFTQSPVALTGGLSRLPVFVDYLAKSLGVPVIVPPQAPYLAALGAALMAWEQDSPPIDRQF
ncbi:MAG: acyl-CoA dehydratase activase [Candidatus Adiutrix sp.]|jgi:predicted CoA-substrate-specific enzyme activase|nr:acyl-CoA dehydratase activase [Candidatus Adiutrix sp.]